MAPVKADVETVASRGWNDVRQLVQTLGVLFVYQLREANHITVVHTEVSLISFCDTRTQKLS